MKILRQRYVLRKRGYNYLLYLPHGYEEKDHWPLILFLHGAGERGDDLHMVASHGIARVVEEKEEFPFVTVSPQCPAERGWDTEKLRDLLMEILESPKIDLSRIYLTGLSMGGYGAWAMAISYPEIFAALAPVCGGGDSELVYRIKDLPVWVFHGAKDRVVPLRESQIMVDALRRYSSNMRFTVYADAGHDSWTATYNNPELYQWFLSHKRAPRDVGTKI